MTDVLKTEKLYEGKAKVIYGTNVSGCFVQHFKDHVTMFNNPEPRVIEGKGVICAEFASIIMKQLGAVVPTHFVERLNEREQLVQQVEIVPLEVVVRNVAAGSIVKNLGLEQGYRFREPIVDFFYKRDDLKDPIITHAQIIALGIARRDEILMMEDYALKVNIFLRDLFEKVGLTLVDFKVEFGYNKNNELLLADEISPDTCRLWDGETQQSLDKDILRKGGSPEDLIKGYSEALGRIAQFK